MRKIRRVAVSTTMGENHAGCRRHGRRNKLPRLDAASSRQPIPGIANTVSAKRDDKLDSEENGNGNDDA
jgi:hypothetical protein